MDEYFSDISSEPSPAHGQGEQAEAVDPIADPALVNQLQSTHMGQGGADGGVAGQAPDNSAAQPSFSPPEHTNPEESNAEEAQSFSPPPETLYSEMNQSQQEDHDLGWLLDDIDHRYQQ